ncbi:MAG TPA: AAA domain-containing protein, partial [Geobacteraceae bacterium]|nr:AAA domain-containing protein [Geobacteraceae bacterium]
LTRIENFNIRTSILEFFEYINNFTIQLNKYFRGYREIISYSNRYFYRNSLQVMKIRGDSIDDVLAFTFIGHDGKLEPVANTNRPEVDFITAEMLRLKDEGFAGTVGIITPHTNQQKMIMEAVNTLPERDWLYDHLRLKIMTFDTCQGEERDLIYYSMVANPASDRLWGIFVKDLANVDVEEDGKIKAQRLNVGFSRAKERMHFVISKPLEQFIGSIGEALRHYWEERQVARQEPTVNDVDPKSPMEREVLGWILNTPLWQENHDNGRISLVPQFKIGSYLNQLDRTHTYRHPKYKADFFLTYRDDSGKKHHIIIEYDGFQEHFVNHEAVTALNYDQYYCEEDVYRQKTIEGYGYKFLRINRFNSGKDPVATLDRRLRAQIAERPETNGVLDEVLETIDGLRANEVKECPKCKKLREIEEFYDSTLVKGVGRICNTCKGAKKEPSRKHADSASKPSRIMCPKCGANMVLRRGKYGRFYGCSIFPSCKGTVNL